MDVSTNVTDWEAYKYDNHMNVSKADLSQVYLNENIPVEALFGNISAFGNTSNLTASNATIYTEEELLQMQLGVRRNNLPMTIILTAIYCIIFISGTVGNTCTCIVIAKNNYMKTATNYYLFSLAISDMLTLVLGLPPEVFAIWQAYPWIFGKPFCYFKIFLSEMTSSASVLTITAFTIERYIAICYPIRSQTISNLSRAIKIIIVCWIIACGAAIPYPVYVELFYAVYNEKTKKHILDSLTCNIRPTRFHEAAYLFQISTFALFVTPMTIITVLYIMIGITLRKSAGLIRQTSEDYGATASGSNAQQSRKTVLKMLVAVVVAFFVCWAPFHLQRLLVIYLPQKAWTSGLKQAYSHIFYVSGVLYFFSSTINPILYNLMSKKYREAFRSTLCCCMKKISNGRLDRSHFFSERSNTYVSSFQSTLTNRVGMSRSSPYKAGVDNGSPKSVPDLMKLSHRKYPPKNEEPYNNGDIIAMGKREKSEDPKQPGDEQTVCATVYLPKHQIIGYNEEPKNPGTFV